MSIKDLLKNSTKATETGDIVARLDLYITKIIGKDADRALNVNAPSAIGSCLRARYYGRVGEEADPLSIDPRTQRIFDNGTAVHERLQKYMLDSEILYMDEVPIINDEYNIQGHTDGILNLLHDELGVLEIKSCNSRVFSELKKEKPEHRRQGLIYLFCLEERRKYLKGRYPTLSKFKSSAIVRRAEFRKKYDYLQNGSKYTRDEKINFQVGLCMKADELLYNAKKSLTKVIFLYENKDTQELKSFTVSSKDEGAQDLIYTMIHECDALNDTIEKGLEPPEREGRCKSDPVCRWCNYKIACWN